MRLLLHLLTSLLSFFTITGNYCHAQEIPANQLMLPEGRHPIPFIWMSENDNVYAAMLIPVKLKGSPFTFYMQFDTGSPYSMFYRNKLLRIGERYPLAVQVTDTTGSLHKFSFNVGDMPVLANEISVQQHDSIGINWNRDAINIIGTLGTDLIDNKLIEINYPEKQLLIGAGEEEKPEWDQLIYEKRRILFPSAIKGKISILFFDTGSSAYALLTNEATARSLSVPGAVPITQEVESWGKQLKAIQLATADSIDIAGKKLAIRTVAYIEGISEAQVNIMKRTGISGVTGNRLFLDAILVLDTKNKRFYVR